MNLPYSPAFISQRRNQSGEIVYLNIYDLAEYNNYLHFFGFGVYHSGIEVFGEEYSFGGHDSEASGIFSIYPRSTTGASYRETIILGRTDKSKSQIRDIIRRLESHYRGTDYHIIEKNCNSFTDRFCYELLGHGIPGYVNRLAALSRYCKCCFPKEYFNPNRTQGDDILTPPPSPKKSSVFERKGYRLNDSSSKTAELAPLVADKR